MQKRVVNCSCKKTITWPRSDCNVGPDLQLEFNDWSLQVLRWKQSKSRLLGKHPRSNSTIAGWERFSVNIKHVAFKSSLGEWENQDRSSTEAWSNTAQDLCGNQSKSDAQIQIQCLVPSSAFPGTSDKEQNIFAAPFSLIKSNWHFWLQHFLWQNRDKLFQIYQLH